jgi:ATP-dependent Clp protease, protease subunit
MTRAPLPQTSVTGFLETAMSIHNSVTALPTRGGKPAQPSGYKVIARGETEAEIYVYGVIGQDWFGDGITAKRFADDLKALGSSIKTIHLRVNSDGGVVTEARAMYNLLVEHKAKVIAHIDGVAASAASFLAMAASEIEIAEGGFVMIHNARAFTGGDAAEFRRMADILDTVNSTIVETYVARTGQTDRQVRKWMDAETWFTGKEAVQHGFADRLVANQVKVAASISDPAKFRNLPIVLRPRRAAAEALLKR